MKKILIFVLFFYILALLQTSLFFDKFIDLNFVLILVIFINLFEERRGNFGLLASIIGGFFIDVFSSSAIGFHVLILAGASLFVKMILRRYMRLPVLIKYETDTQ